MPLGNGDIVMNILAENSTGDITMILAQNSAFSEAGELIKLGIVTLSVDPNPFGYGPFFEQRLNLANASVEFLIGGQDESSFAFAATVYIDANANYVVANGQAGPQSGYTFNMTVSVTLVRPNETSVTPAFDCTSYTVSADQFVDIGIPNTVGFFHRNAESDFVVNTLNFTNVLGALPVTPDLVTNRTMGGAVFQVGGSSLVPGQVPGTLVSNAMLSEITVAVAVLNVQTFQDDWNDHLAGLVLDGVPPFDAHVAWWTGFWDRSYIEVPSDYTVSSQYVLQRFIQATQARSPYPLKFNGMLYTANRAPNLDYRDWGALNWWQNLRHPYYNMLGAGDADMLETLFQQFLNTLPFALARTQIYYNQSNAAFWDEYTHPLIGSTHPNSYGCGRAGSSNPPIWYSEDPWNHYNLQNGLDLSLFILDHYAYTQNMTVLETYFPIIEAVLNFYSLRWTKFDNNGKLVFYPTQSLETWQCPNYPPSESDCVTNDAPTIAGLLSVLPKTLALPSSILSPQNAEAWSKFLSLVPPLPLNGSESSSTTRILPCEMCSPSTSNVENTELYPVHPYRLYGATKPGLQIAVNTFNAQRFTSDEGWNQNAMDAAMLGLADKAQAYVVARASMAPAPGYRFPAFMPHLQDYEPSADQLAVFNSALLYMVMQTVDDAPQSIVLFPAWPCEWDLSFKVNGPLNTVIEGSIAQGAVSYTVSPSSRAAHVHAMPCQN